MFHSNAICIFFQRGPRADAKTPPGGGRRERLKDKLARAEPKNAFFAVRFSTRQTGLGARTHTKKIIPKQWWNHSLRSMLSHQVFRNSYTNEAVLILWDKSNSKFFCLVQITKFWFQLQQLQLCLQTQTDEAIGKNQNEVWNFKLGRTANYSRLHKVANQNFTWGLIWVKLIRSSDSSSSSVAA